LHLLEHLEDAEDTSLPSPWLYFLADDAIERQDRDAIEMGQTDVAERRRDAARLIELRRLAHRLARIDEEINRKVLLLVEQSQEQLAESLVGLPVDLPEIVAGRVAAVIRELESSSAFARKPIRAVLPRERALGDHMQVLQLLQEIVFKTEGHWSA